MQTRHLVSSALLGAGALLALAAPSGAHVSPSVSSAPAGSSLVFSLGVGHGCEDAATSKVEVQIPESIMTVTPKVVAGWTIETTIEQLPEPIEGPHGNTITERTAVVTWTGGPLDPHQLEEFGLKVTLPDTPGETIYFPTIQTCVDGAANEWIQIPEAGGEEPESPAPAIALTEATGEDDHGQSDAEDEGMATTSVAASDDDAAEDSDDSDGLAIAGLAVGALGLVTGGTALARTRGRS